MLRGLRDNYKSEQYPLKIFVNKHILGKVTNHDRAKFAYERDL